MDATKPATEIAPAQPESAGFVANIRESMRGFFYSTPTEGHKALDASNPVTETAPADPCQKKASESAGFVGNMSEFFHTPMGGHKACMKAQYDKFTAKFGKGSAVLKEGENSVPLQTTVKN